MFFLDNLPTVEMMARLASRVPEMEPDTVVTYLLLAKTASELLRQQDRHLAKFGLSQARFQLLILLERSGNGEMTPADLTREMGIAMKNTLRLIGYMEKDGIVSRMPHETDRRATIVRITEKGRELLFSLLPGNYRFMNRAFEKLDAASRAALRELLEKVNLDFSTG
ncbi:MAG: MarR family transcriptional regulator [Oxalobacter sp.]|nr:MarR family transcriptional regulator [Oxalobacter sp.]